MKVIRRTRLCQLTKQGGYELTEPSDGIAALASVLERRPNNDGHLSLTHNDCEVVECVVRVRRWLSG